MSGLKRIVLHWSAGSDNSQDDDREHYHFIVRRGGQRVSGLHKPEANISITNGQYAAHTRGLNTGSIGMAMDAMRGAVERPFAAGPEPITALQLAAFVVWVAEVASTYGIPVTRKTILSHAEVEKTLGVWQRGKWDICWLPGMTATADAVVVGDRLRAMIADEVAKLPRQRRWQA